MAGVAEFPHNRIKELREAGDPRVEMYDLAAYLRCSTSTVNRLEAGHIASKYIEPLAKFFRVTADHVLGLDCDGSDQLALDEVATP